MAAVKKNKYKYEIILQQNNGYGWDDVESWETNSSYSANLREIKSELKSLKENYKQAQRNASLRTIHRASKR